MVKHLIKLLCHLSKRKILLMDNKEYNLFFFNAKNDTTVQWYLSGEGYTVIMACFFILQLQCSF